MKKLKNIVAVLLLVCLIISCFAGCKPSNANPTNPAPTTGITEEVDYAGQIKLNMSSETAKQEVTVHQFVDGDTTHFNVPESVSENGILKARYLAINTPESTGKIEEYGKAASNFTKEKLSSATSIIVESDTATWDLDSTGGRYLVWIWYKTGDSDEYRNLNIEILQNGLALASSSANNRYGSTCVAALNQAKALKRNLYSGEKDPLFYYGEAVELSLKELRCNIESYNGMKVAFEGVVTVNNSNGVYVEDYDAETGMYYGIYVYYGFGLTGDGLNILTVGNRSRIVGSLQYYEAGDSYQVSGLTYRQMKPDDPGNIQKISDGHKPAYVETDAQTFLNGKREIELADGTVKEFGYAELALGSSISMKNLLVKSVYTTSSDNSSSNGAMTLTCEVDGQTISVRTIVLLDENGQIITQDAYEGKCIDVKGVIDCYDGVYQIKVFSSNDISIVE